MGKVVVQTVVVSVLRIAINDIRHLGAMEAIKSPKMYNVYKGVKTHYFVIVNWWV